MAASKQKIRQSAGIETIPFPSTPPQHGNSADIRDLVLDQMEQGIMVWSAQGICELLNARYHEMMEVSELEVYVGLSRTEHLQNSVERHELSSEHADEVEAGYQRRKPFTYERTVGIDRIVSTSVRPLDNGGHVVTFTDITESRRDADKLKRAMQRAATAEKQSSEALKDVQARQINANQFTEFSDWLQCARSIDELYDISRQAIAGLFPGSNGQLFIYSNSRDVLDGVAIWGSQSLIRNMQPQDCWSLRRGHTFRYGDGLVRIPCNHVEIDNNDTDAAYLCLPIVAHGDTVGLLHISFSDTSVESTLDDRVTSFARRCAELLGVAIANVQLRDELHEQSTRDSLTGLFNRRYFQERCRAELARANRENSTVGLIAFDVDNFKNYNDTYGHEAGDKVLCELCDLIRVLFEGEGVAARVGGEEFAILLPQCDVSSTMTRAQKLVDSIYAAEMRYLNKPLPHVSISAGVAEYPKDASALHDLIRCADRAQYRAKELGKNRVIQYAEDCNQQRPHNNE